MSGAPVLVLGDVVTDVVVRTAGPPLPGTDRPATIAFHGGGAGGNVASWLAACGAAVHLVARVGDDARARDEVAALQGSGVVCHVVTDRQRPTGTIVVLVDEHGERAMLPDRGANLNLAPGDIPADVLAGCGHLHVSGYTLLEAGPRPAARQALTAAREQGLSTSVDTSSTTPLREAGPERFLEWTGGVSLCRANRSEAALLTGTDDLDAASAALAGHYEAVVITLGADGALYRSGRTVLRAPAAEAAVIDTTGAGDAFTAGFLAARLAGDDPAAALAAGARLAAQAVGIAGGRPAIHRRRPTAI